MLAFNETTSIASNERHSCILLCSVATVVATVRAFVAAIFKLQNAQNRQMQSNGKKFTLLIASIGLT